MRFYINKAIKKCRNILSVPTYRRTTPVNYYAEDIYLVSYPKSGNTWLRFLIANALKIHFDIPREVNFFSLHEFIPDIHTSRHLRSRSFFDEYNLPRIIKSHSNYNPYYNRVILLIRDPRDVCISYYYFLRQRKIIPQQWTISDLIRSNKYGVKAWLNHTKSWYSFRSSDRIVQVFRYEELLDNPQAQLQRIADLLGIDIASDSLAKAVILSSKKAMKASENNHLSSYLIADRYMQFVRKGKAGKGAELSASDKQYIENITGDIVRDLGYHYD